METGHPAADGTAPNAHRLLLAGSIGIFAAGAGFAVRGGILDNWGAEFGFNATQLGALAGAGFAGFCFGIVLGGLICDKLGYGRLVAVAFTLHVLSAVVTFGAAGLNAYLWLYWGMLMFGLANGALEAVANPLVATLFPTKRAHYLNLLHASWPAGLVAGAAAGWLLDDQMNAGWWIQLSIYLIPTLAYGLLFLRQPMPRSEAAWRGLSLGEMLKDVGLLGSLVLALLLALFTRDALGAPSSVAWSVAGVVLIATGGLTRFTTGSIILFALLTAHLLLGAFELGTDGWIQNITGNILTPEQGKLLFILASATMFALRFSFGTIERHLKLSPLAVLLASAILACVGLTLASGMESFMGALVALLIYAVGKAFLWPTMLAVASDRFPATGAIAISLMGGIGMMSGGLLGTPGLGYVKDSAAASHLQQTDPQASEAYRAERPSHFLFLDEIHGLDGAKLAAIQSRAAQARRDGIQPAFSTQEQAVHQASIAADRLTLRADALIPAMMAVIYLLLLLHFRRSSRVRPSSMPGELAVSAAADNGAIR